MTSAPPRTLPPDLSARLDRGTPLILVRAPHGTGKAALAAAWTAAAPEFGRVGVHVPPPPRDTDFRQHCADALTAAGVPDLTDPDTPLRLALERIDLIADPTVDRQILDLVEQCPHLEVLVTVVGRRHFTDPLLLDPTHDLLTADDLTALHDDDPTRIRAILDDAHPAHRALLLDLATAPTLTTDIARHLGAGPDPEPLLDALDTAGLVEHRDTPTGPSWRIPAPVRAVLRDLQTGPDAATRSARLAHHLRVRGDIAGALRCATDAQDWTLAVDLVADHWIMLVGDHLELLRDTLFAIPRPVLDAHPGFREGRELLAHLAGDLHRETVTRGVTDLRLAATSDDVARAVGLVGHQAIMLRIAGRYDTAAELTDRIRTTVDGILATRPDDLADLIPFLRLQWGLTLQLAGDFTESVAELHLAYTLGTARRVGFVARNAAGNIALHWALAGEPTRVQQWLDHEAAHPPATDRVEALTRIGGVVARVHTALDRLDTTRAATLLATLDDLPALTELWPFVVHARSRYAVAAGRPDTALATLTAFPDERARARGTFVRSLLDAATIEAHLAAGDAARARDLADRVRCDTAWATLAVAHVHLATGDHTAAIRTCRRFDWLGTPYTRPYLGALLVESAAQHALGHVAAATRTWARACELADRTGIASAFATVPRGVAAALAAQSPHPCHALARFLHSGAVEQFAATPAVPELTARERNVLDGLARGETAAGIAATLFVSLSTVKTHRRTLFRKLGAGSRAEALTKARGLGLLL
ncbi:helix-turn-helix transcriptional regulator [Prescottella subtropica]|uniref:helix-turn-helix transcriptional regulator n=1 Tax=Prescottella subtropica TaxID=2545757 RepID=UPI0010F54E11|nr:helix-turn-helix transcriptional regulator [Prescottella subtropica]